MHLFGWEHQRLRTVWPPIYVRRVHYPQRDHGMHNANPGVEGVRRGPGGANRATESRDRTTVYIYLPAPGIIPTGVIFGGHMIYYGRKHYRKSRYKRAAERAIRRARGRGHELTVYYI